MNQQQEAKLRLQRAQHDINRARRGKRTGILGKIANELRNIFDKTTKQARQVTQRVLPGVARKS